MALYTFSEVKKKEKKVNATEKITSFSKLFLARTKRKTVEST